MSDYPDQPMCPNCVTPWKCNGPHITEGANMTALTESRAECERLRVQCQEEIRLRSVAAARAIAAETEFERLRRDAERYRWLRSASVDRGNDFPNKWWENLGDSLDDDFDAAIDAASAEGER